MACDDLVEPEVEYLLGLVDGKTFDWGAALGQALEVLEGRGYVQKLKGRWSVTEKGRQRAEQLRAERAAADATPRGISDSLDALDGKEGS